MVQKLMMKPEHVFLGDLSVLAIWGDTSCFLSLCLPPKPVTNSSEATYNVSIPWVVCSSKNPHSFIGWTQAMFSKPFCKRQGWFAFILRTYFKALRSHLCHFRVWTEQCKEASVQTENHPYILLTVVKIGLGS